MGISVDINYSDQCYEIDIAYVDKIEIECNKVLVTMSKWITRSQKVTTTIEINKPFNVHLYKTSLIGDDFAIRDTISIIKPL